jgi:uncharacterized protein YeaO (DUF488 family)
MAGTKRRGTTGRARSAHPRGRTAGEVRIARAYEEPAAGGGYRVLVDRLWPRGVSREALAIDAWTKEVAPSDELRRWFGHDPTRWETFAARYRDELRRQPAAALVDDLVARARRGTVTLVYGAKDELHNQAVVLRDVIAERLGRAAEAARHPSVPSAAPSRAPARVAPRLTRSLPSQRTPRT